MNKKYCNKCGCENDLDDMFCGECGEKLDTASVESNSDNFFKTNFVNGKNVKNFKPEAADNSPEGNLIGFIGLFFSILFPLFATFSDYRYELNNYIVFSYVIGILILIFGMVKYKGNKVILGALLGSIFIVVMAIVAIILFIAACFAGFSGLYA